MRKIITIILCAWCGLSASAQYSIYSVSGDAKIKSSSATWVKAKKGANVRLQDSICVGNKAHVQLLNKQTSQIFESTTSGVYTIIQFINNARKQSGRVIAELNKEMYQNVKADNNRAVTFVGASTRGEEDAYTDSLYACLRADLSKAEPLPEGLTVKAISKKKAYFFAIDNGTDKGYYVNILIRNIQTGELSCAFVIEDYEIPCYYIAPGASLSMESIRFVWSKAYEYTIWATEHPYDSNHLQNLLLTKASSQNIECKGVKIFVKKVIP